MRKVRKITPDKVQLVKDTLKYHGIRETARKTGISFFTCQRINAGYYDRPGPLQERNDGYFDYNKNWLV